MKKPVHYILWKTQPGGAESLVTAYIEHFSKTREQYLYSLRPSENELSSLPELHFQAGYEKTWIATGPISGIAANTATGFFTWSTRGRSCCCSPCSRGCGSRFTTFTGPSTGNRPGNGFI
ncbi:MAG: hypothetical protein IPM36_05910 [Lewinellaceae bacterium]|nr:hypothetical protein [Lewinellaceae bacterium]